MHITAKVDYGVRAVLEIAAEGNVATTATALAAAQDIPAKFLEGILGTLVKSGILVSHRGPGGGYALAGDPSEITIAEIVRAIDGPLAAVRGVAPEDMSYDGSAAPLRDIWVAARAALRLALESATVSDLVDGHLPDQVRALLESDGAYRRR